MARTLTQDWQEWIELNVKRGCDKDGIFRILIDEGFEFDSIVTHMDYQPTKNLADIANPLKTGQSDPGTTLAMDCSEKLQTSKLYLPNAVRLDTNLAELYLLPDFLNQQECEEIIASIKSKLRPSEISAEDKHQTDFRTSRTCDLGTLDNPFLREIDRRICNMLGVDASYAEVLQGQHYKTAQEFKPHTDYFEAHEYSQYAAQQGQRTFTFFIYLNEVVAGGETEFPRLGIKLKPQPGMAVIWNNLRPDGSPNPDTLHCAHPVLRGEKAVITKWFRARGKGQMYTKEANEFIPNLTRTGFKKSHLAPGLFARLQAFYRQHRAAASPEQVEGQFIYTHDGQAASSLVELSEPLKAAIHGALAPQLCEWSQQSLVPTYVYGIRDYHHGAILKPHRDRLQTHIVSAIINVAQDTLEDWPLVIEDNDYRRHEILLQPGELVFYEGARLLHGRPIPLNGKHYANIFVHFMPGQCIATAIINGFRK